MKLWLKSGVLVAVVLLTGTLARANTIVSMTFDGEPSGDPTLTIQLPLGGTETTETGYIDPYYGTINGQSVLLWCVDPSQDITTADNPWNAYVSYTGNNGSDLSDTYQVAGLGLSPSAANTLYDELAGLVYLLSETTNQTTELELQGAIWQLADGSTGGAYNLSFPGATSAYLSAVNSYELNAANTELTSGFEIITSTSDTLQEYIVLTPEPSTLLLLGVGMTGLLLMGYWKKRAAFEQQ